MGLIDRIKYGKVVNTNDLGEQHVAGPVDGTNRAVGANYDISNLIDPSLVQEDGQVWASDFKERKDYIKFLRSLGQAYLDGALNFNGRVVPVNSTYFILPLNKISLNNLILTIRNLENLEFSGSIKQPVTRSTLDDFFDLILQTRLKDSKGEVSTNPIVLEKEKSPLELSEQYLKDLLLWRINCHDYSDYVRANVTERQKTDKHGLKRSFIVNRGWSKANQNGAGDWRVIEADEEKIIISGYQNSKGGSH